MEESRLRRLDALFAERVLGCKVGLHEGDYTCDCKGGPDSIGWHGSPHGMLDGGEPFWPDLRNYTRSLDAAFDAARHFGAVLLEPTKYGWRGHIGVRLGDHEATRRGVGPCLMSAVAVDAAHPAEALCLACLRAVGCSEEELR